MRHTPRGSERAVHKDIESFVYWAEGFGFHFKCIGKPLEGCMVV